MLRFLCALRGHRLRWYSYTWTRSFETLTFGVGRCLCGEKGEAVPVSAVPHVMVGEAGQEVFAVRRNPRPEAKTWLN